MAWAGLVLISGVYNIYGTYIYYDIFPMIWYIS